VILVVSLIGLLSVTGIWMIQETAISHRVTTAMVKNEEAFNRAEGALQLAQRCLKATPPSIAFKELISTDPIEIDDAERLPSYIKSPPAGNVFPEIFYVNYNTDPPPGWAVSKQAYSGFYTVYYMSKGTGKAPSRKGDAKKEIVSFAEIVMH
jgi:hypothetical protein